MNSINLRTWYFRPVLMALSRIVRTNKTVFTERDICDCVERLNLPVILTQEDVEAAMNRLRASNLATLQKNHRKTHSCRYWTLTSEGVAASAAAWRAFSGQRPDREALATRLWNLLRIRGRMTTEEAASTLANAGEGDFQALKKTVAMQLNSWSRFAPDAVAAGSKREAGHLRYVLIKDIGFWPPPGRAGEMHPSALEGIADVPAHLRKPVTAKAEQGHAHA